MKSLLSKRTATFFTSLLFLVASVLTVRVLIANRPEPEQKAPVPPSPLNVDVTELRRGRQAVNVTVFGTVKAEKTVLLNAPLPGQASATRALVPGVTIQAGEALFQIDTTVLDLAIERVDAKLQEARYRQGRLQTDTTLTHERLKATQQLTEIARRAVSTQQANLKLEKELFESSEALHTRGSSSNNEFLAARSRFNHAELALLDAQRGLSAALDAEKQLAAALNALEYQQAALEQQKRELKLELKRLADDRRKATIAVDFTAQIEEVYIDTVQEVMPGTPLVKLRNLDAVELELSIPDLYFSWLYAGSLLDETKLPEEQRQRFAVQLVNAEFSKTFSDAYIKSFGSSVNHPTRSLPLVLGRRNPVDSEGRAIAREELKPGMYCSVTLQLAVVEDAFALPRDALQTDSRLYLVDSQRLLAELRDVTIVHDSGSELIVKLPVDAQQLQVVSQPLNGVAVGTPVTAT